MAPRTNCPIDGTPLGDDCCGRPCPWVVCSGAAHHVVRRRDAHVAGTNYAGRTA